MPVWERLDALSDSELRSLTTLAVEVLLDAQEGADLPPDPMPMSTRAAARQVLPALQQADASLTAADVQAALEDDAVSRQIATRILAEVRRFPALADAIEARYEAQQHKLAAPELLLLAGALLALAVKLKEVKVVDQQGPEGSRKEFVVKFSEATEVLKGAVAQLIRSARGG